MNKPNPKTANSNFLEIRSSRGFTLVEVLVAMIIMTSGLLGIAYLQNWSVKFSQEAYARSQLLSMGNQMIDYMRSSQIDPNDSLDRDDWYTDEVNLISGDSDCDLTDVTTRNRVVCFYEKIADTLPNGTASIELTDLDNDGTDESYQVTVFWSDRGLTRQADLSLDNYDSLSAKSLDSKSECDAALNRAWSTDLDWPFNNAPGSPSCLVSYSWVVQVFNPNSLGSQVSGIGG